VDVEANYLVGSEVQCCVLALRIDYFHLLARYFLSLRLKKARLLNEDLTKSVGEGGG
jgi:hypothetical protein